MLLYLTWDPDGTQSRIACLYHLTAECWNALATLPTQLEYSKLKKGKQQFQVRTADI